MSSNPQFSILATGSEILDGRVIDTNTNFIIEELSTIGVSVGTVGTCGDDLLAIERTLKFLLEQSDGVIVSGGLGPTTDDVTRYAIAQAAGVELFTDAPTRLKLEAYFKERNRIINATNYRQAEFPVGSTILTNSQGTAPGFALEFNKKIVAALPGVPFELKNMLRSEVLPLLVKRLPEAKLLHRSPMRIFGLPESEVGSRVESCNLPPDLSVSYRAAFPEVHVILKHVDRHLLDEATTKVIAALGPDTIISQRIDDPIEKVLHNLLLTRQASIAVAESMTGGALAAMLSSQPGSSQYFRGGFVTYADELKSTILGIDADLIRTHGAVSSHVTTLMAERARVLSGATFGVSVTGFAGPDAGSASAPAGTFFLGLSSAKGSQSLQYFYPTGRNRVRAYAVETALDLLRRELLDLPLRNSIPVPVSTPIPR